MVSYQDNDPKGWCGDPKRGVLADKYLAKNADWLVLDGAQT